MGSMEVFTTKRLTVFICKEFSYGAVSRTNPDFQANFAVSAKYLSFTGTFFLVSLVWQSIMSVLKLASK